MARLTYKFMCSDDSRTGKGINQRYIPHSTEVKSISYITAVLKKQVKYKNNPTTPLYPSCFYLFAVISTFRQYLYLPIVQISLLSIN